MNNNFKYLKLFEKLFQCHTQRMSEPPDRMKTWRIFSLFDLIHISMVIPCFYRKLFLTNIPAFSDFSQVFTNSFSKFFLLLSTLIWRALISESLWFHTYYYTKDCSILHCTSIVASVIIPIVKTISNFKVERQVTWL